MERPPRWVWIGGAVLGLCRLAAFFALDLPGDVAQWQLNLIPLLVVDFPWSFIYVAVLPYPIGEMMLGPMWWALLPYLVWKARRRAARSSIATSGTSDG